MSFIPSFCSLVNRMSCLTASNAFFRSRNTPTTNFLLFISLAILLVSLRILCMVDLFLKNPNWLSSSSLLFSRWFTNALATIFSNTLEMELKREIGL